MKDKRKGRIFVVSGPSGAGKTSICNRILKDCNNILFSISCTTRKPRQGEENGREYFFLSKDEFETKIENNEFIEWEHVYDNYYGTPKKWIYETIETGIDVLLDIDVKGARALKAVLSEGIFVFIAPPSKKDLKRRIAGRKTETENTMKTRLEAAKFEMESASIYDYIIENNILDIAVEEFKKIRKGK